jgi:hypothetical protein
VGVLVGFLSVMHAASNYHHQIRTKQQPHALHLLLVAGGEVKVNSWARQVFFFLEHWPRQVLTDRWGVSSVDGWKKGKSDSDCEHGEG